MPMRAKAIIEYTRRVITQVKLAQGNVYRIKPGGNYLIIMDRYAISQADVATLNEMIYRDFGAKSIGVVLNGEAVANLKVVEVSDEQTTD